MERVRKHVVQLTAEQRQHLEAPTRNGAATAKMVAHARVLLMSDRDHPKGRRRDDQIAAAGVHLNTVKRVCKLFVTAGLDPALRRKPRERPPVALKLDGRAEAHLVALCCSPPPEGRVRWTLRLPAEQLPRCGVAASVCAETARRALKKTRCSRGAGGGTSRSGIGPAASPRWRTSSTSTPPSTPTRSR